MSVRLTLVAATAAVLAAQYASAQKQLVPATTVASSEGSSDDMMTTPPTTADSGSTTAPASTVPATTMAADTKTYPITVAFRTSNPESFWDGFKTYLDTLGTATTTTTTTGRVAMARGMDAAAVGDVYNGRIFLGCTAASTAYSCAVGFSDVSEANAVVAAANAGSLGSVASGAEITVRPPSFAAGRSTLAALAAVAVSAVTMLLA